MSFSQRQCARAGELCLLFITALVLSACRSGSIETEHTQRMTGTESLLLAVTEEGFHRVTLEALQEAGLAVDDLRAQSLQLSQGGQLVPTHIDGQSFIFYGQAPQSRYASYRPYVLDVGASGLTMQVESAAPDSSPTISHVPHLLRLEENNHYDGRPLDGSVDSDIAARDPWFWETIEDGSRLTLDFEMPGVPDGPAHLELRLIGASQSRDVDADHDLDILLNGSNVGAIVFDGETAHQERLEIDAGLLRPGANTLVLDNSAADAAPFDIVRLDWIEVEYMAEARAVEGRLVTHGAEGNIQLDGFNDQPMLFDAGDPHDPRLLHDAEYSEGRTTVSVDANMLLAALDSDAFHEPSQMAPRDDVRLLDPEIQADLIIIAPDDHSDILAPLIERRQDQGLTVKTVSYEQILKEFADYEPGPDAINAFLRYTHDHWSDPKPAYILLVGDGSYDYRDYLNLEPAGLLPAPMVAVSYSGETVSDARMADVNGDFRPDLAVGRWPVSDRHVVADLVERTLAYEQDRLSPRALFAADGTEPRFETLNQTVLSDSGLAPANALQLSGPTAEQLSKAWAEGAWLVTYAGHGSLDRWGKDNVLESRDVPRLDSSSAAPIVLQLTCLTGYFAHPTIRSLSEEMLLSTTGPVAIVGATSLSLSVHQRPFGTAFIRELQNPAVQRIGDALQLAKLALDVETDDAMREISDTFTLFGDPSMPIRRPAGQ